MKSYKPYTDSRRHMTTVTFKGKVTTNEPHKALTKGGKRDVGRNNAGRISVRHKGGGHKRLYRLVDFRYDKKDVPARVGTIEYDPNRSCFIALAVYADGEKRYVLLPSGMSAGEDFLVSENAPVKKGNRMPIARMPVGTFVFNIEVKPLGGAKLARSAGNFAEVLSHDAGWTSVRLPSGEVRKVHSGSWASVGAASNEEHNLVRFGKAGRSRWKGIRPTVRGSAMNPVDHPYGGGEGRQGRGTRRAKTAWGKITGGRKTRRPKKYSNVFIVSRRPKRLRKR